MWCRRMSARCLLASPASRTRGHHGVPAQSHCCRNQGRAGQEAAREQEPGSRRDLTDAEVVAVDFLPVRAAVARDFGQCRFPWFDDRAQKNFCAMPVGGGVPQSPSGSIHEFLILGRRWPQRSQCQPPDRTEASLRSNQGRSHSILRCREESLVPQSPRSDR